MFIQYSIPPVLVYLPNWGCQQHQDNTAKYLQNMFRFRIVNGFPASINAMDGRAWKLKMTLESQTTSNHNGLCKFRTQLSCIEKLQVKLSLHDVHERMLDMYIYSINIHLDHLSMCEHVASILHLFAKPQKWDSILEVQGAHMYRPHSLMPSPWKHPPKTHQETMPSAKFAS